MAHPPRDQIDGINFELGAVRDQVDGVRDEVAKMEGYLRQGIIWLRSLIIAIISLILVVIIVFNFFAPKEKDVPQQVIDTLQSVLNLGTLIDTGGVAGFPLSKPLSATPSITTTATATHNSSWMTN